MEHESQAFAKKTALAYQRGCRNKLLGPWFLPLLFSHSHYQLHCSVFQSQLLTYVVM